MPHDMDGKEVWTGDRVMVECVVKQVSATEDYCNATLETVIPMQPCRSPCSLTVNLKQVKKIEKTDNGGN